MVYITETELARATATAGRLMVAYAPTDQTLFSVTVPGRQRPQDIDPEKPWPSRQEYGGYLLEWRRVARDKWELTTPYQIIKSPTMDE